MNVSPATSASPVNQTCVPPPASGGGGAASIPTAIGDFLTKKLGKAAFPVAIGLGAAAGGGLGFVTLGPVGGIVGAVAGGWFGALCVGLRP